MGKFFKEQIDECHKLIDAKVTSYDNSDNRQDQSSRLEWTESSWIRWPYLLFWCWIIPLLSTGYKRSLTKNDLDGLPHNDKSSILLNRLQSYDWNSTSTWKIIFKEFWKDYIFDGILFLPFLITRIVQPLLIRQIILYITNEQQSIGGVYLCAISLFICTIISSLFFRLTTFRSIRLAVKIRNALTGIIYTRSLSMKSSIWQQMNTGQIINLITNDTKKFEEKFVFIHYIWEGPFEAIIMFGLLCWVIQPLPTVFGYIVLILFVIMQMLLSRKLGEYHSITASRSDKRVHAFNEFVHGCHIIKMYNWDKLVENQINELRQNELASIKRASYLRAIILTQSFLSTPLVGFVMIISSWLLNYPLNATNTFTALAFLALIRSALGFYLSLAIEGFHEMQSTLKRIDSFMRLTIVQQQKKP